MLAAFDAFLIFRLIKQPEHRTPHSPGFSSVETPSTLHFRTGRQGGVGTSGLFADVRHQSHESSSLDRLAHSVLARSRATRFATGNNATVAIYQFREQLDVLVIDVHWARPLAIDQQWILFLDLDLHPRTLARNSLTIGRTTAKGSLKIRHVICVKQENNRGRGNSFPQNAVSRVAEFILAFRSLQ